MKIERFSLRPGIWGERSQIIPVLVTGDDFRVIDQPQPPFPEEKTSADLANCIAERLRSHSATSLEDIFPSPPNPVYELTCGGPVVFVWEHEPHRRLREEYGSDLWEFTFVLLSRESPTEPEIDCNLPVARHLREDRSLVSHRTGKKSRTLFRRIPSNGNLQVWEARTTYLRPDQIRLHAFECGIRIAGETVYGNVPPLHRGDFPGKRRPGGSSHVLFSGPSIHLVSLSAPALGGRAIRSNPPKPIAKWIDHHRNHR